jgi:LPXTG-motif cell wall-anchored protein
MASSDLGSREGMDMRYSRTLMVPIVALLTFGVSVPGMAQDGAADPDCYPPIDCDVEDSEVLPTELEEPVDSGGVEVVTAVRDQGQSTTVLGRTLARTGADSSLLALLGAMMLLAGAGLLVARRKSRAEG